MGTDNRRCAQLVNTPRGQGRVDNFTWEILTYIKVGYIAEVKITNVIASGPKTKT